MGPTEAIRQPGGSALHQLADSLAEDLGRGQGWES